MNANKLETALRGLLAHVDATTCTHENTKRGGVIWTICEDCDRKWADDKGGFKPHTDAPAVAAARAALDGATKSAGTVDELFDVFRADKERASDNPERSATFGMTLGERIAHVGGRENAQGYVEFGSPMAVNALIQHVLRDLRCTSAPDEANNNSPWFPWLERRFGPSVAARIIRETIEHDRASRPASLAASAEPVAFYKDGVLFWHGEHAAWRGKDGELYAGPPAASERAPVGDERAAFGEAWERSISKALGPRTAAWLAWHERAALASAPVVKPSPEHFKPPFGNCSFRMCDLPGQCRGEGKCHHPAGAPVADRQRLRELVDVVWNEATESTAVPDTPWADRMIDKVFPSLAANPPVAGEAQKPVRWMMVERRMHSEPEYTQADPSGIYESVYVPLYAAPQASPAADERDAKDAARWRKIVSQWRIHRVETFDGITLSNAGGLGWDILTRQVDAAIAAQHGNKTGTNSGHGHVWERPDGLKAKCDGPGFCAQCSRDQAAQQGEGGK